MTSPIPADPRPVPLRDAFKSVGSAVAFAGSLVVALVGYGVLSSVQGDAIVALLGAIPGVVSLVTALAAAFGVVVRAEPQVTPSESPAVVAWNAESGRAELVALVPARELAD